tara:strand:+ start:34 stop:1578 length:1545 start_codon:yes stop_codon:yes gene_type:complete
MKKTIPILISLIFYSSAFSQSRRIEAIDKQISSLNSLPLILNLTDITVTPEKYILEISVYAIDSDNKTELYIEEIYTGDRRNAFIPVMKIENITLNKKYIVGLSKYVFFKVHISRKWDTVYFTNVGGYNNNFSVNVKEYGAFVDARVGKTIGISDSEKPKIYLNYPKLTNNFYRTEELFLTLEGKATDNMGLLSMMVNDVKVKVSNDGFYKKRLKLKLGTNSVILKAQDINNNIASYDFVIIRDEIIEDTEFSDVDYPKATGNKNSNAVAVVFGIESYRNAPNVSDAVNDADIFREYLIKRFGLNRENIYLRLDEQATKGEFDKVFSSNGWISRNTNRNSDVFIYYAGHGAPDVKTKETFLVPYDGDPNYATSTGFAINELYENLSDLNVKSITLIMDACFTGSSRDNQPILADARPVYIEIQPGNIPSNMVVFTASSGNEISSGYSEKNHGIFTYFLLKGLNGNADGNGDRKITVNEMSSYLSKNVPQQARKMGREQNPQLLGSEKNRILLAY